MKLIELTQTIPGSAAAGLYITCLGCQAVLTFAEAHTANWRADVEGPAFRAYYCPSCQPPDADKGPSLYQALKAAGVPLDSHESDLYVKATPEALAILKRYGKTGQYFKSQIDGTIWIDLPFLYEPFWDAVARKARLVR